MLLYEGDDHASRAARAAFEMRRTLRAIGRPRTSLGAVQLKMHAGLHSGRFQFFLVGESHRELLICGPSASATVTMESASEAGEILLSAGAAALVGPAALGDPKGGGTLLRAAPDVRGSVEPLPNVEGIPVEVAVPAPLRAQLLEMGPLEGEHRHVAIAFIRFTGRTRSSPRKCPEAAADALDILVRAVQAAAEEHRVTFLESDIDRDGGESSSCPERRRPSETTRSACCGPAVRSSTVGCRSRYTSVCEGACSPVRCRTLGDHHGQRMAKLDNIGYHLRVLPIGLEAGELPDSSFSRFVCIGLTCTSRTPACFSKTANHRLHVRPEWTSNRL